MRPPTHSSHHFPADRFAEDLRLPLPTFATFFTTSSGALWNRRRAWPQREQPPAGAWGFGGGDPVRQQRLAGGRLRHVVEHRPAGRGRRGHGGQPDLPDRPGRTSRPRRSGYGHQPHLPVRRLPLTRWKAVHVGCALGTSKDIPWEGCLRGDLILPVPASLAARGWLGEVYLVQNQFNHLTSFFVFSFQSLNFNRIKNHVSRDPPSTRLPEHPPPPHTC